MADIKEDLPLVSVIVLTYESFDFLLETLNTIYEQDYPNMELIISDDSSEEFSPRHIEGQVKSLSKIQRIPYRVLKNEHNLGIVAHANKAAKLAKGKFIKFLSPGDGFTGRDSLVP